MSGSRVAIVQPWLPQYRKEFYTLLRERGKDAGFEIDVFTGEAPPEWRARNDTLKLESVETLSTRAIRIFGRNALIKSSRPILSGDYDFVILEQAVRNLESYALLARSRRDSVAFWGHGKTYTKCIPRAQEAFKYWLTRRGSWFFGYTSKGVEAVVDKGFPAERTTVLNNSFDAAQLHRDVNAVTPAMIQRFSAQHDLKGRTAVFIGGLDESKRLPFLIDSADIVHDRYPDFRLLIVGSGSGQNDVKDAARVRPWLIQLGTLFGADKAAALASSQVIAMPGRVGLVAVDSFAAARPIVTTAWPWHAPEFEYLEDGVNAIITEDDVHAYAAGLSLLLGDQSRLDALQLGASQSSHLYTVEGMVDNFLQGLKNWHASQSQSRDRRGPTKSQTRKSAHE